MTRDLETTRDRLEDAKQGRRETEGERDVLKHTLKAAAEHISWLEARAEAANAIEAARKAIALDALTGGQMRGQVQP